MKNRRTYYQLILDRSGSMTSCIEQTIEGVNQQICRIKEMADRIPEQDILTSLTLFNTAISSPWTRINQARLREISFEDYRPRGGTALLDAIGITIDEMQKSVGHEIESDQASAVVIIITDGYENSSRIFTHEQVSDLIKTLESTGKWSFSYIGATLDAVQIARSLNIKGKNSMRFNTAESDIVYTKLNVSLDNYMNSKMKGKISDDFLKEDEKE
ncbi:MAG: vWA domain-containing protein [Methanosarcina sp.]